MSALRALVAEHAGRLPLPRVRVPALVVPRPRTLAIVAAAIALLAGGWLWLRDSSLVRWAT